MQHHPRTNRSTRMRTIILLAAIVPALGWWTTGKAASSILDTHGPRAASIATMTRALLALGGAVFVVVLGLFVVAAVKGGEEDEGEQRKGGVVSVVTGGVAIPVVLLVVLFGYTLWSLRDLAEPAKAAEETIQVVGHQWWWEVTYPDRSFTTANEIHIPVGKPVEIELTSADVIHSFWVPELSDKLDLIPGSTNTVWLEADEAGEYRGQCAEFCGTQHALMAFVVIADSPDRYDAWVQQQQQDAAPPSGDLIEKGQQIYFGSACIYCHTIKGTSSAGKIGPDLTHLGSRSYLAAGTLDNTTGNLAGWISNPQSVKPGNKMPAIYMSPEDLHALIAYLESLK